MMLNFPFGCATMVKESEDTKMKHLKSFLNMFNIFDPDLTLRSYKSPLLRIFGSIAVMAAVLIPRLCISIENLLVNVIVSFFVLAVMILSTLCLFVASVECLQVGDNRKKDKARAELDKK